MQMYFMATIRLALLKRDADPREIEMARLL